MQDPKFIAPAAAAMVVMVLALVRVWKGPTVFDRILAGNLFGTKTTLLIAIVGFLFGRPEWLDLALVYALMNFIGVFAILRYAKFGSLVRDDAEAREDARARAAANAARKARVKG
jgi:multicomponent Na+:H+ antiporter subunit F